ncbi:MAG: S1-like domain-containing RNA-binding protein [Butyrivibrio sp.]|nr:S1-like domain-containing RNA-binding protein [Butyrivibrio sp.]
MIALGEIQTLTIVKKVDFGVYLADKEQPDEKILLPIKQVPADADIGGDVEVFVYKDSKDRPIATVNRPLVTLGGVAKLKVAQIGKNGAFLNWGLEKDLLLPFKEQIGRVEEGKEYLVALYIDKSSRLCATMYIYPYLRQDSPYVKDDKVTGTVYEISDNFGAFVAVDNIYSALIPKNEIYGKIKLGEAVSARISEVREDGKLTLSIREKAYLQIEPDAERLLEIIDSYDGVLPFTDKASPETIKRVTQMSKNEFKRAVGHLLKERKIAIGEKTIYRV